MHDSFIFKPSSVVLISVVSGSLQFPHNSRRYSFTCFILLSLCTWQNFVKSMNFCIMKVITVQFLCGFNVFSLNELFSFVKEYAWTNKNSFIGFFSFHWFTKLDFYLKSSQVLSAELTTWSPKFHIGTVLIHFTPFKVQQDISLFWRNPKTCEILRVYIQIGPVSGTKNDDYAKNSTGNKFSSWKSAG